VHVAHFSTELGKDGAGQRGKWPGRAARSPQERTERVASCLRRRLEKGDLRASEMEVKASLPDVALALLLCLGSLAAQPDARANGEKSTRQ